MPKKLIISCVPFDKGKSGISVYIRNLVAALKGQGNELTLIVEHDAAEFFPDFEKIILPKYCGKAIFSMLYHLFVLPFKVNWSKYDACIIAAANRRCLARFPIFTEAVVHDLSQYHIDAKYDAFRMFYIKHLLPFFVRRAQAVIAISHSTEADLKQYWHIPEEKIHVVYNGLSLCKTVNTAHDWKQRCGITRPYILYISRLEHPGKNHMGLLQAFEALPRELAEQYDIVMPGADWPGAEIIHEAAKNSPLASHIFFPGFIANEDMADAYSNAACYIFPSFFEGFGLSLIEAMHYGCPTACSNTSSLAELGKDAAITFSPSSIPEITEALKSILTDNPLRQKLIAQGKAKAGLFDWNITAENIEKIIP